MIKLPFRYIAIAALVLGAPRVSSGQLVESAHLVEDFNAPGAAWESGWLGLNSDLGNYYCRGHRGCTHRGNAPAALWPWGGPHIVVHFNPTFGATITSFAVDVGNYVATNLLVYDLEGHMIYNQPMPYSTNYLYNGGPTFSLNSSNGISRFEFDGDIVSGNVNINNVAVNVTSIPEPASMVLLGTGLLGVFGAARQMRKRGAKVA